MCSVFFYLQVCKSLSQQDSKSEGYYYGAGLFIFNFPPFLNQVQDKY